MGLIDPGAVAFAALAAVWLVLAWRERRRVVVVPALFLWKDCPEPPRRRIPPRDWLVALQLATLAALVLSLARPYTEAAGGPGGIRHVLLLDRSASMQADEGGQTRWQLATERLRQVLGQIPATDEVVLASVADQLEVLLPPTHDHERVWKLVQQLEPYDTGSRLAAALAELQTGEAVQKPQRIVVFSDFADPDLAAGLLARVQREAVGSTDRNVSVEEVRVEQHPWQGPEEARAVVTVRNHSNDPVHALLTVEVEGSVALRTGLTLDGQSQRTVPVAPLPRAGWLAAELAADDALPADNVAWAWVHSPHKVAVCLWAPAGHDGRWLRELVGAVPSLLWAGSECRRHSPSLPAVHVFWHQQPPAEFAAPALVVAPPRATDAEAEPPLSDVRITDWDAHHPVLGEAVPNLRAPLEGVVPHTASASDAVFLWARAAAAELPLAWSRESAHGSRQVWLALDLARQLEAAADDQAWPLVFLQALAFLSPTTETPRVAVAGSPAPLPDRAHALRVVDPAGRVAELAAGTTWFVPRHRGTYTLQWADTAQSLRVVAAGGSESDIAPKLPAPLRAASYGQAAPAQALPPARAEWSQWFLVLATLLLCGEAWLAARRAQWNPR